MDVVEWQPVPERTAHHRRLGDFGDPLSVHRGPDKWRIELLLRRVADRAGHGADGRALSERGRLQRRHRPPRLDFQRRRGGPGGPGDSSPRLQPHHGRVRPRPAASQSSGQRRVGGRPGARQRRPLLPVSGRHGANHGMGRHGAGRPEDAGFRHAARGRRAGH